MWEFICLHEIHRRTYKRESQPTGLDGIVALLDGYDCSSWLRYNNTLNLN